MIIFVVFTVQSCTICRIPVHDYLCCIYSAGVGRTGVFITLSIVLERMGYEGVVDMFT